MKSQYELFGGDLRGVEQHLDHVASLGANALYLTPFFPAGSVHRYDATSFEHVDPLLGGDEALRSLLEAAHARDIRVIGDLTTNHVGIGHDWFAKHPDFFYVDGDEYAAWMGVPTLPKLNWESAELRAEMVRVVRKWLDFGLDGWRIDVANMTGRHGDDRRRARRCARGSRGRRRRRHRGGARSRLSPRPRRRRLARRDELRRLPAARLVVAARRRVRARPVPLGLRGAALLRRAVRRVDASLPRGGSVAVDSALVDAPRQPRLAALPDGGEDAREAARRRRPADDDARACR